MAKMNKARSSEMLRSWLPCQEPKALSPAVPKAASLSLSCAATEPFLLETPRHEDLPLLSPPGRPSFHSPALKSHLQIRFSVDVEPTCAALHHGGVLKARSAVFERCRNDSSGRKTCLRLLAITIPSANLDDSCHVPPCQAS